ncbi:amino acid permease [Rhodococcus kroppenstedtii]|uniref:Amino acid/polyamine/organocation transporter, APC superfamily n=1 Tax=Rhodococcoides kroppenstedtii TaxID=293050 RepID=A0A1I0SSS9_9NOCA|nr:amino acid permease [Rhodococcus kroppenstedtii]MBT1192320.1 amino acid permease [Rhodococcus kroppenstedtii]MBY6435381.1 amino acid permease [Rhodococcus kroppenstedtii]MDV7197360.1 amino acid permease [Rhodococcus kroppenstedtii]NIL79624.1 putative amino acid permease YhdG [Rhodococcus kroppenstedtii]SFA42575.1 amino acid/polyamine/organocation transporter, APC superfamily [Rhodococcus kroppenstedtii]
MTSHGKGATGEPVSGSGQGLRRTKSIEQSIQDTDEPDTKLKKTLNSWDLTVFGVAVAVGAGIFTLTARTAGNVAGPAVSLAFVFAAIACGLAALCYAEFASTVPVAGSAYTFSYATFGEFIAWIIGWDLILEFALAAAVVAKGWSLYLGEVLGTASPVATIGGLDVDWGALLIVVVLSVLLVTGVKISSRVSLIITAIKVAVVLLIVVVGAFYIKAANYSPYIPPAEPAESETGLTQSLFSFVTGAEGSNFGWYGLLAAASLVFFAFIGFDIVATTAEETVDPQRSLPRGILGSLAIVTVLYVAVTLILTGMVNYTELAGDSSTLATAFELNGITWAQQIISFGALAGLTTVVMVLLLGQSRVLFAMSRDGLMPRALAKTGSRGTPVRITVLVAVVVAVLATFFPIGTLEEMVNIGTLFAFVLVSIGVVVLRRTRPDLKRGFRTPLVPLVPILAVVACLWLMLNLSVETWLRFVVWMALGVIVYFAYSRRHSVLGRQQAGLE